ncbi:SPASM domain-containing protein [Helicobacter magdeburgensis]|uniref:SPASM domain-containing protein n=1 Tax=Helicobacter magdeburgensis TaxID=471858 RepID=UPI001F1CAD59|nr:SPASM domain-containing protein [Helicobacter magdeburgensis]
MGKILNLSIIFFPINALLRKKNIFLRGGGINTESPHNSTSQFSTSQPLQKPLCSVPFNEVWINSDCSLILCCKNYFDSINFGSLLTHDFLDLYRSQAFEEIRQMQQYGIFPQHHLCKQCLGV